MTPNLSYSSLRRYLTCPRAYYLSKQGYETPLTTRMLIGLLGHKALEDWGKGADIQTALASMYADVYTWGKGEIPDGYNQDTWDGTISGTWPPENIEVLEVTLAEYMQETARPDEVEISFDHDGINGRADALYGDSIIDYKFTSRSANPAWQQLQFYAWGLGLQGQHSFHIFQIQEIGFTRTYTPRLTKEREQWFLTQQAIPAARGIENDVFPANDGSHCAYCDYGRWCK